MDEYAEWTPCGEWDLQAQHQQHFSFLAISHWQPSAAEERRMWVPCRQILTGQLVEWSCNLITISSVPKLSRFERCHSFL